MDPQWPASIRYCGASDNDTAERDTALKYLCAMHGIAKLVYLCSDNGNKMVLFDTDFRAIMVLGAALIDL